MRDAELSKGASAFADRLSSLLNGTVCKGIRVSAVLGVDQAIVGYKVGKASLTPKAIPLTGCKSKEPLSLHLSFRLTPDEQKQHLMVVSSVVALAIGEPPEERTLFHADYERDKSHGYPEAHLQVCASSPDWAAALPGRSLEKLHLPAGGRRFRTTVEDVVVFLVCEGLVEGRAGWESVVEEHRRDFEERQLRAAIRRNPRVASEAVAALREEA